jgi:K+-sensing histidine kinase KdpD
MAIPERPAAVASAYDAAMAQHVLICVTGTEDDLRLMRHGALLAKRLRARLTVLYVLMQGESRPTDLLAGERFFARSLGAPLVELPACSLIDGITDFAAARGVTQVVISSFERAPWYAAWRGPDIAELAQRLGAVDLYVLGAVHLDREEPPSAVADTTPQAYLPLPYRREGRGPEQLGS